MDGMDVKKRKANFSETEKERLVQEYEKEFSVFSSKFGPNVTTKKKHDAWLRVATAMNGRISSVVRTTSDLQKKWQSMCSQMKDEYRTYRRESAKTGGGQPPRSPSPLSVMIASVLGEDDPTVYGIEGGGGVDSLDSVNSGETARSSSSTTDSLRASTTEMIAPRRDVSRPSTPSFTLSKAPDSHCSPLPSPCPSSANRLETVRKQKNNENPEIVEMQKELLALEKQRVELEIEKLAMEKDKLAMEMDVLKLKKQKLSRDHVPIESQNYQTDSSCSYSLFNMQ